MEPVSDQLTPTSDFFLSFFFKEREKNINVWEIHGPVASRMPPAGDLAHNPGLCLVQESNQPPLIHRPALNPLSHTSQGPPLTFITEPIKPIYCLNQFELEFFLITSIHKHSNESSLLYSDTPGCIENTPVLLDPLGLDEFWEVFHVLSTRHTT